ncbi:MAG: hypothetical protein K2X69_07875 [Silvanigrellaceae bacterium]|nr:hypothetical protein [Silvanigrellaceae bacterium]
MKENKKSFLLNLGLYSVIVQKYFWVLGVPYIILSPFIWGNYYKPPAPQAPQVMPIMIVDTLGNAKKLTCEKNSENELLPLAKNLVTNLTKSFFSWPQNKSEASARMATFAKYFSQDKNNQAQSFLGLQMTKILSESSFSQAAFEVTGMAGEYDPKSIEFVIVLDGFQTVLKNDTKTTQKFNIDVYLKKAAENRTKYEDVVLEITKIKVKTNENI